MEPDSPEQPPRKRKKGERRGPPSGHAPARPGVTTRFGFVANSVDARQQVDQKALREAFEKFCKVVDVVPVPRRGLANVVVETEEAAVAAVAAVGGQRGHGEGGRMASGAAASAVLRAQEAEGRCRVWCLIRWGSRRMSRCLLVWWWWRTS